MRVRWHLSKKLILICALFVTNMTMNHLSEVDAANIFLRWEDTSDNEDGFKIERLVGGIVNASITVQANITSYIDSGLATGAVYCYRARAYNSAGDSNPSNQVCATAQDTSLTVSPSTVTGEATVMASWTGISITAATDWIGLYAPGAADTDFIDWIYVSCSQIPSGALAAGSCSFPISASVQSGTYELRLLANDRFTRLATSNALKISRTGTALTSQKPSLTVSPTTAASNGTVSIAWSGITTPSTTDWIGLYAPGAADTNFIDWIYVSCSQIPSGALAAGSCSFPISASVQSGTYDLRLLANDGFTALVSSSFIVTTTPAIITAPSQPSGLAIQLSVQ